MGGRSVGGVLYFLASCCFAGKCQRQLALEFACLKKIQCQ